MGLDYLSMNIYDIILEWDYIILGLYSWYCNICSWMVPLGHSMDEICLRRSPSACRPLTTWPHPWGWQTHPLWGDLCCWGVRSVGAVSPLGEAFREDVTFKWEIKWRSNGDCGTKNPVGVAQNSGRSMVGSRLRCSQKIGWINKLNRSTDLRPSQTSG